MPTQADDSLSSTAYAQILDLVSEGPIFGPANSETPARSVYFNGTVVQNSDGSNNFNVKQLDLRTGTLTQDPISGFDSTANEVGVGVELKASAPWVHTVTNLALSALRVTLSVSALSKTDSSSGDVKGYQVAYQIQLSKDGGQYATVVDTSFNGKASSVYQRSHRIELSGAASQYTVKVIRLTADTTDVYTQDTTNVVSYTELIDAKLRYPMSAVCGVQLDASEFSSVPTRSYDMKGLLIKYPSNYNPLTRAYIGTWDGTFTTGWTDNPAWVFYDLVLNSRYGLGKWVDASMIDRYDLYQIAQYCDVLVSDGAGGTEPRFSCNCYIASRTDAYKVLQDIASVFRGMAYWGAGEVQAACDMPLDTAYVYTAANVIGGQFKYVGSSLKTRYTCAVVTWNDPENGYEQAVEYVEDADGVARYGINKAQLTAFACTSRAQAQRVGQWALLTSRYETNTVTFSVGLDGTLAQPGQIIAVADPSRAGKRTGGRIRSANGTAQITLDKALDGTAAGDSLTVILPSGKAETHTVSAVSGAVINVSQGFSVVPAAGAVWMLESATLKSQLFRVASVSEKDGITFEITATQHEPGKYAAIDNGAAIDFRPITGNTLTVQSPPTGVTVSQYVVTDQGISKTNMSISWAAAANAVSYTVQWRKDNGDWVTAGTTGGLSLDVSNIYSGNYTARVRATNGLDISSPYAYSSLTGLLGKTGAPPVVASLSASTDKVFAINVAWSFPAGAGDTAYTEIYYSHTANFASATQQGRYSYPTTTASLLGLAAGYDLYFWVRLVDTTGNVGAFYPASTGAGAHGQSSADASAILGYLTGQITQSQLGQDVLSPIQAIPGIQTSITANATAIAKETTDRTSAIGAEATARAAAVTAEASARADAIAAEALARGTAITSEATTRSNADSALSTRIDTVTAANGTNAGAITSEATTRASADTALGTRIDAVVATSATNTAAITSEATTRATADTAMAADITLLGAHNAAKSAFILNQSTVQVDASTTLAQKLTSLSTADNNNATAITTETTARTTADTALGTRIDNLTATVTSNSSAITAEQTARATGDSANASSITALTATVGTKNTTFRQATQPSASVAGDTWVDTGSANLITYSEAFDNAAWTKTACTTTPNATTAPDGTSGADKIVEGSTTASPWVAQNPATALVSGTVYTHSVYAKAGERSILQITGSTGFNGAYQDFDLANGVKAAANLLAGFSSSMVAVGGGWFRCSLTGPTISTGVGRMVCAIKASAAAGRLPTYAGTGTSGLYLWGLQMEQSPGAGRYIPTASASVSTVGNNSLLVWDGTTWVLSQDAAIPANTAAITSEATTRATADSALSTRIDTLSSTVDGATAAISSEATTRAGADSALSSRISTVEAQYVTPPLAGSPTNYAGAQTAYAGVYSEMTARAEADLALAQTVDTVSAAITTASSNMTAAINTEQTARVTADSANASAITTVQANLDSVNSTLSASVQTNANAYADLNGRVSASYTIKTQITSNGRTYIAGIGVGVDNSSGTVESQVLVAASRFAILDPNGTAVSSPFVVQGGQVFMSSAFIADASITNAKIGGVIQSNAVGANGQPRWSLDKNGVLTMNGANAGSGYLTINDSTVTVYDGAGTLRVRMGIW